jgi:hypothetical protein
MPIVKGNQLIIAVLALSLFCIISGELRFFLGLPLNVRWVIGLTEFGANLLIGIYGVATSYRIAWSAYLVLSVVGFVMVSAATPISALWLTLKLL